MSSPRWIVNSDCRKSALIRLQTITWVGELASGIFGRLLASFCRESHDFFGSSSSDVEKSAEFFKGTHRDTGDHKQFCDRN